MSYDIGIYHRSIRDRVEGGEELGDLNHPVLDRAALARFVEALAGYGYRPDPSAGGRVFSKDVSGTPIEFHVFTTEITVSIPYWRSSKKAIVQALKDAAKLVEPEHMCMFDPQTGEWADAQHLAGTHAWKMKSEARASARAAPSSTGRRDRVRATPSRGATASAKRYIKTTDDTVESLHFLLDNIGVHDVALDLSLDSIDSLERIAMKIHEGTIPRDAFPELLEHYSFLLPQYCALVILHAVPTVWGIDPDGRPYIDADPSEEWQRYYPWGTQRELDSGNFLSSTGKDSLRVRAERLIEARMSFETLRNKVKSCIRKAANGAISEAEIVRILVEDGAAPDPGAFAMAFRGFPKRVGRLLRNAREFSKSRTTDLWRCREMSPNKSLERTRGG